jgi:hypothetical protein
MFIAGATFKAGSDFGTEESESESESLCLQGLVGRKCLKATAGWEEKYPFLSLSLMLLFDGNLPVHFFPNWMLFLHVRTSDFIY